jgi:hypothetical protein
MACNGLDQGLGMGLLFQLDDQGAVNFEGGDPLPARDLGLYLGISGSQGSLGGAPPGVAPYLVLLPSYPLWGQGVLVAPGIASGLI